MPILVSDRPVAATSAQVAARSNPGGEADRWTPPTEHDVFLFREGTHRHLYRIFGAHIGHEGGEAGVHFVVWAPNAAEISVIGDFNAWTPGTHPLTRVHDDAGIWHGFVSGAEQGQRYKYRIRSAQGGYTIDKSDPFAFRAEIAPATASVIDASTHAWRDEAWMTNRASRNALAAPMSIYEVHLGSWCRSSEEGGRSLSYREIAPRLADYVTGMGFTHVELLPVMEHPFFGSWGYQCTGYFAPTSRYGSPADFMALVDHLHAAGIGVILDWVPSHFPSDAHGLAFFDGTHLFEHADRRQGFHPEWNTEIFNYGRNEVRSFLLSSAIFWMERFHADGLRVDAVASMLYLDYSRKQGEWVPNRHGGRENLEAIEFLKSLNQSVYAEFPDTQTFAEESTAWPLVSRPVYLGGLGFGLKWNMGWMHDTLAYMGEDPVYRKYHHGRITFSIWYAFHENFVLPLSHDEVVYGKGSLFGRMPGDPWRKFANLRLLFGYMWAHPGKKLLFMGGEFGQPAEWNHDGQLDWARAEDPSHAGVQRWVRDLNAFYAATPALFERDFDTDGFRWVQANDADQSVLAFLRRSAQGEWVLAVFNFTPVIRENYRLGVPVGGLWEERLNSDAQYYGGSGQGNLGGVEASPLPAHGHFHSLSLRLPPLGAVYLSPRKTEGA